MPPSLSLGAVNIPTHSCVTTQELAQAIRFFQQSLGVGPGGDVELVLKDENGNFVGAAPGVSTFVINASVNKVGGVTPSDVTYEFDEANDLIGATGVTTGTAYNVFQESLADDQRIILTSVDLQNWYRLTQGDGSYSNVDLIVAYVYGTSQPQPGATQGISGVTPPVPWQGSMTFWFYGATAAIGSAPAGGIGYVTQNSGVVLSQDERLVLIRTDYLGWQILEEEPNFGGGGGEPTLQCGMALITSDVPAASLLNPNPQSVNDRVVNPGTLFQGALLLDYQGFPLVESGQPLFVDATNCTPTPFYSDGTIVSPGTYANGVFTLAWPDFNAAPHRDDQQLQIVYIPANEKAFAVGGENCPTAANPNP